MESQDIYCAQNSPDSSGEKKPVDKGKRKMDLGKRKRNTSKSYEHSSYEIVPWVSGLLVPAAVAMAVLLKEFYNLGLQQKIVLVKIIDAWAELLQLIFRDYHSSRTTMMLTSKCWDQIACSEPDDPIRKAWIDDKIDESLDMETILFSLLTCGSSGNTRKNGDHWTLLKYTVKSNEWRFFNPMKPRDGTKDPHYEQALVVVKYVEEQMKEVLSRRSQPSVPAILKKTRQPKEPIIAHCPQQMPDSLDCGVVICWLIEMALVRNNKKMNQFSHEFAADYRKKMIQWFVEMIQKGDV